MTSRPCHNAAEPRAARLKMGDETMSKTLIASAAILLIASASANAGMLLYSDANDDKVVVNNWSGQSFDPIARQLHNGTIREYAAVRHARANSHGSLNSPGSLHRLPRAFLIGEDTNGNKVVFSVTDSPW
jgi:hypothetical protein